MRALKVCPSIGCVEIVSGSSRYCPTCTKDRHKRVNKNRDRSKKSRYGKEWQAIRADYLERFPFCARCGQRGNQVDHIIPIERGGSNNDDNLQTLCRFCHSRKTASVDGGFGNPVRQGSG